jgi:hypothetical protein
MQMIAGIIGLCAYIPLIAGLVRNTVQQSFAAFLLWAMLDAIATITTFLEDGNYWLPFSNVVGATTVTVILAVKKQISWSWIETLTALLVVVCLIVWSVSGETAGIIASSLAVVIASIPQMVETYQKPNATPILVYLIFLAANIVSLASGKSWTIEERFYAGCSVFLCSVIVLLALRKRGSAS